jgi:hypothetical protein
MPNYTNAFRKANLLNPIPEYNGVRTNNAAQKWIQHCKAWFKDNMLLHHCKMNKCQKVTVASSKLKGAVFSWWDARQSLVNKGHKWDILTWQGFAKWITDHFEDIDAI